MTVLGHIKEFDVRFPERWESHLGQVEGYLLVNRIAEDRAKAAALLCLSGPAVYDVAVGLCSPEVVASVPYQALTEKLSQHFMPARSELYWRLLFAQCVQKPEETATDFVAAVRHAARWCRFPDLENRIRDQIVFGLRDDNLQQKIVAKPDMSLNDVVRELRAFELKRTKNHPTTDANAHIYHASAATEDNDRQEPENSIDAVIEGRQNFRRPQVPVNAPRQARFNNTGTKCASCGAAHQRSSCKFRSATCHNCGKTGHLKAVCRSQPKGAIHDLGPSTSGKYHTHSITLTPKNPRRRLTNKHKHTHYLFQPKVYTTVSLQGIPCRMEIDSGSAVSIISAETFKHICRKTNNILKLSYTDMRLADFQKTPIKLKGRAAINVTYKTFKGPLELLIAEGDGPSLIGLNWFKPLGIKLVGVNHINTRSIESVCKEFADVFDGSLGKYKGPPVSLKFQQNAQPIRLKPRRVPFALKEKIESELERLVGLGVLEQVEGGTWETPIVTPVKPNGQVRVCADFKATVNKYLNHYSYPVPAVKQVLAAITSGAIFAKLDMAHAYLQLPVTRETADAQTIVTHRGAFKVNRLMFGISAAPGIFQEVMERTLRGIPGVCPYFDDILIAGECEQNLADRLFEVLSRFRSAGLKLKKEKCSLGVTSTEFLGYKIDAQGIHPTDAKLQAIHKAPVPKNKQELQAFLGLLNFYHSFLPHKAAIAEPLHRLLDKKAKWQWGFIHDTSFRNLKKLLTNSSTIALYDERKPLCIACDASPYGIGAVLSHLETDGSQRPIAFYSRTLTKTERNYAQLDKEALAIVAGVKKFHDYVYGREFTVFTDHKPLLGIFTTDKQTPQILSPRVLRWSTFLSAYSFRLVHKPGRDMSHADGLSRLPIPAEDPDPAPISHILAIEELLDCPLEVKDIAASTANDIILSRVLSWILAGWVHKSPGPDFQAYFNRRLELSVHKGCILWGSRVIIPTKHRSKVLQELHEGHPGIVKMKALARSYFWWPGLDKAIEEHVALCSSCQQSRPLAPRAQIHKWESPQNPWSRIHLDFAGPFQGQLFLIIVDSFSRWLEVVPISSLTSANTIQILRTIFATHGLPNVIVTDNGTQFTSSEFKTFTKTNLIKHVTSAPFHPASNGLAEVMVKSTKDALRRIITGSWHHRLANFLLAQHTTPCTATGRSPAELRWGRRLLTKLDRLHPDRATTESESPVVTRQFAPGDFVWSRNFGVGEKWTPAIVVMKNGPVSYLVEGEGGRQYRRHLDQLRKRVSPQGHTVETPFFAPLRPQAECIDRPDLVDIPNPAQVHLDSCGERQGGSQEDCQTPPAVESVPARRSSRLKKTPAYLRDYEWAGSSNP